LDVKSPASSVDWWRAMNGMNSVLPANLHHVLESNGIHSVPPNILPIRWPTGCCCLGLMNPELWDVSLIVMMVRDERE
jgi:hypothetical protein